MLSFSQALLNAEVAFDAAFSEGVEAMRMGIDVVWPEKARRVMLPGTETAVYGFLAEMPLFRKWTGDRETKRLRIGSYTLTVDDYEFEYEVHRNDIKYDRFGIVEEHFRGAGAASIRFENDLINGVQSNGKNVTCFDGQAYYSAAHPQGLDGSGPTFSNLWTSMALNIANVTTRYQYMTQIKDANGRRMGIRPNVLEYGPGDMANVRTVLEAEIIGIAVSGSPGGAASQTNTGVRGLLKPMYNPDLDDGVWYLHDTRVMKPFILQEETAPTGLEMRMNPEDPHVWKMNAFLFGARATAGAGVTLPHLSTRCEE